ALPISLKALVRLAAAETISSALHAVDVVHSSARVSSNVRFMFVFWAGDLVEASRPPGPGREPLCEAIYHAFKTRVAGKELGSLASIRKAGLPGQTHPAHT